MEEAGIHDPLFMQDNSGIHTAKLVRASPKIMTGLLQNILHTLNPIEHVWAYMEQKLGK